MARSQGRTQAELNGLVALLALAASMPCSAQFRPDPDYNTPSLRIDYSLGLAVLHSDNIDLADSDARESDDVLVPSIEFQLGKQSSDLQLRARGNFQYLDYRRNVHGNDVLGDFAGKLDWFFVPDRLALHASDYLGRAPIDVFGGFSPVNQQQINVATVGPSLYMRMGDRTRFQVDQRFSRATASQSDGFDNRRMATALRLSRDLAPDKHLSANAEYSKADFDSADAGTDYHRYDLYAGYRQEFAKGTTRIEIGYSRLLRDGLPSASDPFGRFDLDWNLAPRHRLTARMRYEFADAATDLIERSDDLDAPVASDLGTPTIIAGADIYRLRRFEIGYQYNRERLNVSLQPYVERIAYEPPLGTRWNSQGVFANATYRLRPRLSASLQLWRENRDIPGDRKDHDRTQRVSLEYQFTRELSGWLGAQLRTRDSNFPGGDYRENQVMAGIVFRR